MYKESMNSGGKTSTRDNVVGRAAEQKRQRPRAR